MNYYIQGSPTKAQQIKAAFKKLGINVLDFGFADKTVVYCSIGECVQYLPYSINLMNILYSHPDYKELELAAKPKFKVGDWIANDYCAGKVIALTDDAYLLDSGQGIPLSCEHNAHLWTIEDAEDGDVLVAHEVISLFKEIDGFNIRCHFSYHYMNTPMVFTNELHNKNAFRPATKDERELLFAKMKEAGYEWDVYKKELRKIQPHYAISNFKPKQWVLVRDADEWEWALTRFSYLSNGSASLFVCINGASFQQCIPFEGNEHLLGTTDMPSEEFINW